MRELLMKAEDDTDGCNPLSSFHFSKSFPDVDMLKLEYHLKYLSDAGFVEGEDGYIVDITPYGRDYLENIRNHSVWEETKKKFQPLGSVTVSVISEIAKSIVLSRLGL